MAPLLAKHTYTYTYSAFILSLSNKFSKLGLNTLIDLIDTKMEEKNFFSSACSLESALLVRTTKIFAERDMAFLFRGQLKMSIPNADVDMPISSTML
jgi:hypothetical protein